MYPDTSLSHNYYATLAEPTNPTDHDDDDSRDDNANEHTHPVPPTAVLHPSSTTQKKTHSSKRVNWTTALALGQDKPKHIPRTTTEQCNTIGSHRTAQRARAIIDSGATGHYGSSEGEWIQTTTPSHKVVGLADGSPVATSVQATLPYHNLPREATDGDIIPGLKNDLVSVKKLADAKLTTILHERGAEVYPTNALTIIATTGPVL